MLNAQRRLFHTTRKAWEASSSFNAEAAQRLGLSFQTPNILQQALTHKSFRHGQVPTNERLVAVGQRALQYYATNDAVQKLGLEGQQEALDTHIRDILQVDRLASQFDKLQLNDGLQCDESHRTSPSVKAKAMQALVGAVYHDKGLDAANDFVKQHVF